MNPFILSFLKLITGLLGLIISAGMKWSKEQFKLRSIRDAIELHKNVFPYQDCLLYKGGTDRFMKRNHPQTVDFIKELWANAFRPVYIGTLILLVFYHTVTIYVIFTIMLGLCALFAEINFDAWKQKKWFKIFLVAIWIVAYFVITFSEYQVRSNSSENQGIKQEQNDSTSVKAGIK